MDVTRTIRYEGPSYQDARLLQGMLEDHGVHVSRRRRGGNGGAGWLSGSSRSAGSWYERQQRELAELQAKQETERRELVERQQQERAEQSGALSAVTQVNHVVVDLESTGAAVAIAAAVKSFRNLALGGKVEVEGEAQGKDDSG